MNTLSRSSGAIPSPVSATSTSIRPATGWARTTTLPSGGVWRIAFWIRLKSTRWSFSGFACAGASASGTLARTETPLTSQDDGGLELMSTQLTLRKIGNEMYVSINTVKTHAGNIYAKLRVGSREDAVARTRELHLL